MLSDFWKPQFNKVTREWVSDGMGGGDYVLTEGETFSGLATLKSSQSQIVGAIRGQKDLYNLSTLEELNDNDFVKYNNIYLKILSSKDVIDESDEKFILYDCEKIEYASI